MNILIKIHKELTEQDFNLLWENALFIFDTNVLLDLYRLPQSAKEDLLNIIASEKLNGRIWLPFQALLEFLNNRITTISAQKNTFNRVETLLKKVKDDIEKAFDEMKNEIEKMQLSKRHSSISPEEYINKDLIKEPIEKINQFIKELKKLDRKQPDVNDEDLIKNKVLSIFENKIGDSFTKAELEAIYKEGEERYKDEIPPGYLDIDKGKDYGETEYYLFEDKKHIRKFGDLIIWQEIIKKAKEANLEFIVFVTNDLKKDWIREKRGKKLGVRYELLNELYFKANSVKLFHIYDTSSFMEYAKKHLQIEVKSESIQEAKDLISIRESQSFNKIDWVQAKREIEARTLEIKKLMDQHLITGKSVGIYSEMEFLLTNQVAKYTNEQITEYIDYLLPGFINEVSNRENGFFVKLQFQPPFNNLKKIRDSISKLMKKTEYTVSDCIITDIDGFREVLFFFNIG